MPLTHFDAEGKARMVDVTEKKETVREATATGKIKVSRDVYDAIEAGTVGKGDVLSVATTAGIMGVKRTADLIPMCHILPITNCKIRFEKDPKNLEITCFCTVKVTGKTGEWKTEEKREDEGSSCDIERQGISKRTGR